MFISVTAEKEGFVITGPDSNGVFAAHKLAEIIVQVSDQADNVSLQVRTSPRRLNSIANYGVGFDYCDI